MENIGVKRGRLVFFNYERINSSVIQTRSLLNMTISQRRINVCTEKVTTTANEENGLEIDNSMQVFNC